MSPHDTAIPPESYATRWYFVELYRQVLPPDRDTFERFLLLSRSDVEWITASTRHHRVGQTWAGLNQLLERDGHELVQGIGVPAAASWATHLELLIGLPNQSGPT